MAEEDYNKLYFEEKIGGLGRLINAQFETVHERLDGIKEQTTKTNSRVTHLEEKTEDLAKEGLKHVINCPMIPRLEKVESDMILYKWIKNHPRVAMGIFTVILIMIFGRFITPVIEKKTIETQLIEYSKKQVTDYNNLILSIDSVKKKLSNVETRNDN